MVADFTPRGVRLLHASVHTPGVVSASDPTIGKAQLHIFFTLAGFIAKFLVKAR